MSRLIGITGPARSGKDTAAGVLTHGNSSWTRYGFADPLKKMAMIMFGWDERDCHGDLKDAVDEFWGISPRVALQKLGTDCVREHFGREHWIKLAQRVWDEAQRFDENLVISDVRFDNEAEWIRNMGGQVLHITRRDAEPVSDHISEAGVRVETGDLTISNNNSIELFRWDVAQLLGITTDYPDHT